MRGMHGYPSPEQVAMATQGASAAYDGMTFDPLWMFASPQPGMGSWLSDLTGIHISGKGVSVTAPKLPDALTGKKKIEPKAPGIIVNVGTPAVATVTTPGQVPNTGAPIATNVPVYTPVPLTGNTPASAIPGAFPTVATLPDGTQIPVIQSGVTQAASGLSAAGPLGLPMYAWLALGAGAFLLLNNRK